MRHLGFVSTAVILFAIGSTSSSAQPPGQFSGDPVVRLRSDGRMVELVQAFSYTDPRGVRWPVPAGIVVDGASIPRPFWHIIGGPFEGRYRNASIVHDYYCVQKSRPWRDVHRVFYDGMISAGVSRVQANIMYYAVYRFGPRWERRVTRVLVRSFSGPPRMAETSTLVDLPSDEYDSASVEAALPQLLSETLTTEQIEQLADAAGTAPGTE